MLLTDFNPMPYREILGWALLSIVGISAIVNFSKFFFLIGRDLRMMWKRWRLK
jgi:hypothetical protein